MKERPQAVAMPMQNDPFRDKRRASDYIRQIPARNLHHGIRLAETKSLPLNLAVSLNFSLTDCPEEQTDRAFQSIRREFGKWVTRPRKVDRAHAAEPTFVWVLENQSGCLNAHWLVHVPEARHPEFVARLPQWLRNAAGNIYDPRAIDMTAAYLPRGLGRYMLKGMYPSMARNFDIRPEYQGWVTGRRIGHSQNIGPVQLGIMRRLGKHPPASRWIPRKYSNPSITDQFFPV